MATPRQQSAGHRSGSTFADINRLGSAQKDESVLARLGKKQSLKRRFGFLSMFGFSSIILSTWETALLLFEETFQNGGPAGLAIGFPIAWLCSMSVYTVIGEMASMAPIAGGQYFWTSLLAPKSSKRFLSYITGWLTAIAWMATLAVGSVLIGTVIQGIVILNYPDYVAERWQGTLLCWAVIAVCVFINTVVSGLLPFIEGTILVLHTLGFVSVLIPLVYLGPHKTAAEVFGSALNEGNWPTYGLSYCVGYIGNVATFVGADAAVHMSEEIENAEMNVPRVIIASMILNGATGYAMVLAVLFTLGNVESVANTVTGFPCIQAFYNATQSYVGATIMTSLLIGLGWAAVIGFLATASRQTWSFARDRGVPGHRYISKVWRYTAIPGVAVAVVTTIPCLLTIIYTFSSTAFEDVVSLSVSGLYASYFVPCSLLLWRRVTGQVANRRSDDDGEPYQEPIARRPSNQPLESSDPNSQVAQPLLVWGPWHIPGILGTINNAFACIYILFVIFWSFWPPETPATPQNMNYSVLVTGAVIGFSVVYYYLYGKKQYLGPLIEDEVKTTARAKADQ